VVGDDTFDPSRRSFTSDELRVAPILPKSQKNFVPSDKKDDHYWTRRLKNNTAAKRSREAKRMKENQITLRTAYLEQENTRLREELSKANSEITELKKRLKKYEYVSD
ncbi:hypothetical protein HELRODRAFT_65817, partial [Helobdella robusta]|uniref:BZIP domain-containing protein n=1 Tax=Helobdella robusta TaxID=6412 RepID=T1FYC9_HELRO